MRRIALVVLAGSSEISPAREWVAFQSDPAVPSTPFDRLDTALARFLEEVKLAA